MDIPENLFHIERSILGQDKIFPFHLYIYNPLNKTYNPFLFGNAPLENEKSELLKFILDRGGSLAIDLRQKKTFLANLELDEKDVPSLAEPVVHQLEVKRQEKLEKREKDLASGSFKPFAFKEEFSASIENDNYMPIIDYVRSEIELFDITLTHTVSLATFLSECLLNEDNYINRIVACSFMMAKNMDMKDEEALADITVAAFFAHLGHTQLDYSLTRLGYIQLNEYSAKSYRSHGGLAQHLIRKSGVEISERCLQIVQDHHERADGNGYPMQKAGAVLDPLALILGAISHLFEYHTGKITGKKVAMKSVIYNIKNKTFSSGLEFEFGDKIVENIVSLLIVDIENKAA